VKSADLAQHQLECLKRLVICPNPSCDSKVAFGNLDAHRGKCPFERIPCPFAAHGCIARLLRKNVDSHEETAMKQHLRLMMKRENEQQQLIDKQQQRTNQLQQEVDSSNGSSSSSSSSSRGSSSSSSH
jgi:TNF receptor-associated factor 5